MWFGGARRCRLVRRRWSRRPRVGPGWLGLACPSLPLLDLSFDLFAVRVVRHSGLLLRSTRRLRRGWRSLGTGDPGRGRRRAHPPAAAFYGTTHRWACGASRRCLLRHGRSLRPGTDAMIEQRCVRFRVPLSPIPPHVDHEAVARPAQLVPQPARVRVQGARAAQGAKAQIVRSNSSLVNTRVGSDASVRTSANSFWESSTGTPRRRTTRATASTSSSPTRSRPGRRRTSARRSSASTRARSSGWLKRLAFVDTS